jgi:beta-galactosidase
MIWGTLLVEWVLTLSFLISIDQALQVKDPISGQMVMRYGGDFDDRHSDYEFSGDGLMFADRTSKPAMQEVRYYYGLHK